MEITFHKIRKIKAEMVKHETQAGASWLQINVCDQEGEHIINCFPENGQTITNFPASDGRDDG